MWKFIDYLLVYLLYSYNFHIALTVPQGDSVDGLFADVVTLGARAFHNATGLLLDGCGTGRPGVNLQAFRNNGGGEHYTEISLGGQDSHTSFSQSRNLVPFKEYQAKAEKIES